MTHWTKADLAELTEQAIETAQQIEQEYCESCTVVAVQPGDKYCVRCIEEIVSSLAWDVAVQDEQWEMQLDTLAQDYYEQRMCNEGWY